MAKWERELDLTTDWGAFQNDPDAAYDEVRLAGLAGLIASKIKLLEPFDAPNEDLNYELEGILECFEDFRDNPDSVEAFDSLMDELYDWADSSPYGKFNGRKACWVKTF